jgi:hypothetical protein
MQPLIHLLRPINWLNQNRNSPYCSPPALATGVSHWNPKQPAAGNFRFKSELILTKCSFESGFSDLQLRPDKPTCHEIMFDTALHSSVFEMTNKAYTAKAVFNESIFYSEDRL